MICSMMASGAWVVSKKIEGNLPAALRRRSIGVVTITAPKVPPRTMMAAVSCATSFDFALFEHQASQDAGHRQRQAAQGGQVRPAPGRFFGRIQASGAVCFCHVLFDFRPLVPGSPEHALWPLWMPGPSDAAVDGPAELHHPPDHLFGGFQHHQLLPGGQS